MLVLKNWLTVLLVIPVVAILILLISIAGYQIHAWGIDWLWAVISLVVVVWLWFFSQWMRSEITQRPALSPEWKEFAAGLTQKSQLDADQIQRVEAVLQEIIQSSRSDPPAWADFQTFWQRCQILVTEIAHIYHPEVKYPLLNIYIPQAYGLIRGTVDDLDEWMIQMTPILGQLSVGQAYEKYESFRQLAPWGRKILQIWNASLWIRNPAAALSRQASQPLNQQATQELLFNFGQIVREIALQNLCQRAVNLYGNTDLPFSTTTKSAQINPEKIQTLRELIEAAEPVEEVQKKPVNILLVGRTGAGKSSLINTLFQDTVTQVDILPSTDQIQEFQWQEDIILWDTPGYEQVNRTDLREQVINVALQADVILLVTPALDPALQMDKDFLGDIKSKFKELPIITIVNQVDKLRPFKEWNPPYNWQYGDRPKEVAIREATLYRTESLQDISDFVIPIVNQDPELGRESWNIETLSTMLVESLEPAKQARVARWMNDLETRVTTAARIIDRYVFQMSTAQGLVAFIKNPLLLNTLKLKLKGITVLGPILLEQIPVEQSPVLVGKVLLTSELNSLFNPKSSLLDINWLALKPLLFDNSTSPQTNAWAFGNTLVEFWTQDLAVDQLQNRFSYYLKKNG